MPPPPSPAGQHRPRQEGLPHTPANPRIQTYSHSHHTVSSLRRKPQSSPRPAADHRADSPTLKGMARSAGRSALHPLSKCWRGGQGVRPPILSILPIHVNTTPTTHQAHPASQVLPQPRSCSTARTGLPLNHPARAPPPPASSFPRKPLHILSRHAHPSFPRKHVPYSDTGRESTSSCRSGGPQP